MTRTLCSGKRADGEDCRQFTVRPEVEVPWFCRPHEAQDGKKRLVSAVVPAWARPHEEDCDCAECWPDDGYLDGSDWYW